MVIRGMRTDRLAVVKGNPYLIRDVKTHLSLLACPAILGIALRRAFSENAEETRSDGERKEKETKRL